MKDKGSAQIHGQIFEYKVCALVFLRATNKGYKFKLASNMEGYGKFDDVVVEYQDDNCRKKHIFLQLKSKIKGQEIRSVEKKMRSLYILHHEWDTRKSSAYCCSTEQV